MAAQQTVMQFKHLLRTSRALYKVIFGGFGRDLIRSSLKEIELLNKWREEKQKRHCEFSAMASELTINKINR
ncbi:hypothetical protein [Kaarinaea lacus]